MPPRRGTAELPWARVAGFPYTSGESLSSPACSLAGIFSVLQEDEDRHSPRSNDAARRHRERLTRDGVAPHADGPRGYPESHGSPDFRSRFAQSFFAASHMGVTVTGGGNRNVDPTGLSARAATGRGRHDEPTAPATERPLRSRGANGIHAIRADSIAPRRVTNRDEVPESLRFGTARTFRLTNGRRSCISVVRSGAARKMLSLGSSGSATARLAAGLSRKS